MAETVDSPSELDILPMRPSSLDPKHYQELVRSSGIDSHLARLNFISLKGIAAYEYLFISDRIPRANTGQVSQWWLRRYTHCTQGGWWCSGLDPLNNWYEMEWGCYKPDCPRQTEEDKLIKYEHPPCTPTRIFCLRVTLDIWRRIADRYHVPIQENIVITEEGEAVGFWQWVVERNIPIIICEGAKKAATLLSNGYAAFAIPGITSGYRVTKDIKGRVICRKLIPEFAAFTESLRTFYICFDYETQPNKLKAVNHAIAQLGELLEEQNCPVKVIRLPGLEKGIDDFIVAQGNKAFEVVYQASLDLETDLVKTKPHTELTYTPTLTFNRRYLEKLPFPESGLVGVKSAKGTGKTSALLPLVAEAKKRDRPILLLTHRIQLGRFLCEKIGINWGINRREALPMPHTPSLMPQSIGLCLDSIWKLNPEQWQGAIVILDEIEQSLWHLLNSDTCQEKRIKILKVFQQLITTVLQTDGLVIAQDADLSDISLDYLKGLTGIEINPLVIVNNWKPENGWDVTFYDTPNPTLLIHQLELDLIAGKKCYVTTDSRSGRYSCETIERYIKQRLEQLLNKYPKTLVVSSQTTTTSDREAANFIENINTKCANYDAVFVTPSLGTGVSIDVKHFDRVYGIFQGVIPDSEARQALARVRANVPRIIWCAKRGVGLIGSGSKNYRVLSYWYQENHQENLALLSPFYKVNVDLPLAYDPIHLRTWAKLAARVNASITLYRQSMLEGLIAEGHLVNAIGNHFPKERIRQLRMAFLATPANNGELRKKLILDIFELQKEFDRKNKNSQATKEQMKKIRRQMELNLAEAVANAPDINEIEYKNFLAKPSPSDEERNKLHKYFLKQRYGVEVTPQLKLLDDRGYYDRLLTHYYLIHDGEYFRNEDWHEWNNKLEIGDGKVFLPDLKTHTLKIEALLALGIPNLLDPQRKFTANDSDLLELKQRTLLCSKHIKRALGINIPMEKNGEVSPIKILGLLLKLLALDIKRTQLVIAKGIQPLDVYQINPETLNDGRDRIFEFWQSRDAMKIKNLLVASAINLYQELTKISEVKLENSCSHVQPDSEKYRIPVVNPFLNPPVHNIVI